MNDIDTTVQSWGAAPPKLLSCGGKLPPLPPPPPSSRVPVNVSPCVAISRNTSIKHICDTSHGLIEDSDATGVVEGCLIGGNRSAGAFAKSTQQRRGDTMQQRAALQSYVTHALFH